MSHTHYYRLKTPMHKNKKNKPFHPSLNKISYLKPRKKSAYNKHCKIILLKNTIK